MRKLSRRLLISACLAIPMSAHAADFVLRDVRVEGLQRISAGTVFNYLPVSVGNAMSTDDYPQIIRALYDTGLFSDVGLGRDGDVLVVQVTERPAIGEINFEGNADINDEDLETALRGIGFAPGRTFDQATLERVEQELLNQYYARGKYAVRLDSQVRELTRNRVAVDIDISEGIAARIKSINIVGNQAFDEDDLLDELELTTGGWLSWITKDDQYSKERLTGDIEILRSYYLDRGYLNFSIDSTQVSITPDKQDIYITINITEGDQYRVGEVRLGGNLLVPEDELRQRIALEQGEVFSRSQLNETTRLIAERLGDEGYAFANVNAVPTMNDEDKIVDLDLIVDPGQRVYVRRIDFKGNLRTQDEVLRREMRQLEGSWFATSDVNRSRERLQRLPFIAQVDVETPPVPGTTDQVDLEYGVTEQRSGSFIFGVGYGQESGVVFNTEIQDDNFLGTGKRVEVGFNTSRVDETYTLAYTNPYWTDSGISRGFRLSYQKVDVGESNAADYLTDRYLGFINFGIPITETDSIRFDLGVEGIDVKSTDETPQEILDAIEEDGSDFLFYKTIVSFQRDTRNSVIFPTKGMLNRVSAEIALPGSDETFYKLGYRHQSLYPLWDDFVFGLRGDVGYGDSYGDTDGLPFFENYYAGGLRSVRGFEGNTLGPKYSNGEASGGAFRVIGGGELFFPTPGFTDSDNIRMSAFLDAGNVWADFDDFDAGELRYSAGVSLMWLSPIGPLIMSVAQPLNAESEDKKEVFQFSFGAAF